MRRLLVALLGVSLAAPAAAADLSGKWRHVRQVMKFDVGKWGAACGAPPRNESRVPNKVYDAVVQGDRVTLQKGRRKLGTHRCLSENPEIRFSGYDPATRTTTCSTVPGNSKSEKGRYVLEVIDANTVRWTGDSEYDWSFQGTDCRAKMHEVHRFERVDPVTPPPEPAPAAEPEPPEPEPEPEPEPAAERVAVEQPGQPRPTRRPRDEAAGDLFLELGSQGGPGGADGLGGLADERRQVGVASSRRGTALAFGIVLATVAISLFAGAFLLVSRRRRRTGGGSGGGGGAAADGGGTAAGGGVPGGRVDTSAARMRCPRCARDFDPLQQYCPHDAAALEPLRVDGQAAAQVPCCAPLPGADGRVAKICPQCAARYGRGETYCGRDGSELVSLN